LASKRINAALVRVLPAVPGQDEIGSENEISGSISTEGRGSTITREPEHVGSVYPSQSLEPLPVPPSVQILVEEVRKVAQGVGIRCVAISCSGIAFGLCRPSPSPLYAQQNSLPPWLSGQIAYFLLASSTVETSAFIASSIRAWSSRQHLERPASTLTRLSFRKFALSHLWALVSNVVERSESIDSTSTLTNHLPYHVRERALTLNPPQREHGEEFSQEYLEGSE